MPDTSGDSAPPDFGEAVGRLGPALLGVLEEIERVARHMSPTTIEALRGSVAPVAARLQIARSVLDASDPPDTLAVFAERLGLGADHATRAARLLLGEEPGVQGVGAILEAMREHCLAQGTLFPVRRVLPVLDAWFVEPGFAWRLPELEAASARDEPTGLFDASNDRARRGGFTVFVPEDYDATRRWPLVVALHGGFGHGADFVWTWLREARARGWIVLAPTSRGATWSLQAPEIDGRALAAMHEYVVERWSIDADRVLLTGLSDGATFTLLHGLAEGSPYTHLAPVAGVLHPLNLANGNVARAAGRRVHWVHGALDWMFPVALARQAVALLERAGAAVEYDEVGDLSHAYPRERNGGILAWAGGAGQAVV